MSRYIIPSKDPLNFHCTVGYDDPLQTFFAHIEKLVVEDDEDETVFVNGQLSGEISSIEELQSSIDTYGEIPPYIREKLLEDKAKSKGPNAFQREMINLVDELIKQHKFRDR